MSHPYTTDLRHAFPAQTGAHALTHDAFDAQQAALKPILAALAESARSGGQPLYEISRRRDDIEAARPVAAALLNNTTDLCILGTGGSSLGRRRSRS